MTDVVAQLWKIIEKDIDELRRLHARIAELESRLNDFTDPKIPGMVSVGLLNTERETCDRLRVRIAELEGQSSGKYVSKTIAS